ncbi:exonuclease 3'-5' domain-containing protein 2-like [Armigeres subalbatus]|uniref:exonuclease 3'-5' domain-containing protein 2-like n=1 Tax=Armigeres subalbatus TaxID=124917 RepID=UPI002ED31F10
MIAVIFGIGCVVGILILVYWSQPKPPPFPFQPESAQPIAPTRSNHVPFKNPFQVLDSNVHIIKTASKCVELIRTIRDHCTSAPFIGLDCEWVTIGGVRQSVALLQMASSSGMCLLIRMFLMDAFPNELKDLLADPKILKVGVEVYFDGRKLQEDYGLVVKGTVDLRHLAKKLRVPGSFGLGGLAQTVLGIQLDKNWQISASNWQNPELSPIQREYAAKDAIVAMKLFRHFRNKINMSEIYQFIDVPFRTKFNS